MSLRARRQKEGDSPRLENRHRLVGLRRARLPRSLQGRSENRCSQSAQVLRVQSLTQHQASGRCPWSLDNLGTLHR